MWVEKGWGSKVWLFGSGRGGWIDCESKACGVGLGRSGREGGGGCDCGSTVWRLGLGMDGVSECESKGCVVALRRGGWIEFGSTVLRFGLGWDEWSD